MRNSIADLIGEDSVLSGAAAERAYDCDAYTVEKSKPTVVALPRTTEDVAAIVRWCVQSQTPFTARGAGTGLSGGALAALGGVIISTKRMTAILETDIPNRCLLAQAGIPNKRISDHVRTHGLHFAPDPSSQTVSTLGGNIAENSGGPHTLKYGVTAQHILGLTIVTPEGEIETFGGKVAGGPGVDFIGLIVGGEGTLGIVTEAWVRLTPLPAAIETCLISFPTVRAATETVAAIVASGVIPAALELMDRPVMQAAQAAFGLRFPSDAQTLLLVECDGSDAGGVAKEIQTVKEISLAHAALEVRTAADESERQQLWVVRKKAIGAMGRLAPSIVTHDGVIPRSKLPEMLDFVYKVAAERSLGVANIFHAGDGNLHPCFYFDDRDLNQVGAVIEAGEAITRRCLELGGSVSGEHGIGVEKIDLMPLMFSEIDLEVQRYAKRIFNDGTLCNPCKVLPNQKSCVEHKKRWRGVGW